MATFSAGPQALGYLYQARVAIALLLGAPEDAILRVEALDDIDLTNALGAGSLSLVQLKHHTGEATLTDSSPDLWKSLRVWSEQAKSNKFTLNNTKIVLFTTAKIGIGSVASLLGEAKRDVSDAEKKLLKVAATSTNKALKESFAAFNGLTDHQRKALLAVITIVGEYPDIAEVKKKIHQKLRLAVRAAYVDPFVERIEGWWNDKVILQLLARKPEDQKGISAFELHEHVASVAETFHEESLPIDFASYDLTDSEIEASKGRQYVRQLEAINASARTIRKSILDYHRAYYQRHRWVRDSLLLADELGKYEDRLRDEWERYFDHNYQDLDSTDPQALIDAGKDILRWAELDCSLRIRPRVEAEYIRRGSFHILTDKSPPGVCWHPQFTALMLTSLAAAANAP